MGITFVNRSSGHTQEHTHTKSHIHTIITTRCHNTSFSAASIKTTLTGALSALVESSRWNVYLYIQMAWCHVVSHNVSWTNNVSHFSIRPAALKPPSSFYSHNNTQAGSTAGKRRTLCCHSEVPLCIKSQGYRGKLNEHCGAECLEEGKDKHMSTREGYFFYLIKMLVLLSVLVYRKGSKVVIDQKWRTVTHSKLQCGIAGG